MAIEGDEETVDVFISYKREDKPFVSKIAGLLIEHGLSVWWDRELETGGSYHAEINTKVRRARSVIVVWSPRSAASRWVLSEATIGLDRDVLVPVIMERCEINPPFNILDTADLSGWSGDDGDPVWRQRVLRRVLRMVGQPSVAPRPPPPPSPAPAPDAKPSERGSSRRLFLIGGGVAATAAAVAAGAILLPGRRESDPASDDGRSAEGSPSRLTAVSFPAHDRRVTGIVAVQRGAETLLATTGNDGAVRLWNLATQKKLDELPSVGPGGVTGLAASGKGEIAVATRDMVRIFDVSGDRLRVTGTLSFKFSVRCIKFSPTGIEIAACADQTIGGGAVAIVDRAGAEVASISTSDPLTSLDFFPYDPDRLIVGSEDKTAQIWQFRSRALQHTLVGHQETVNAVAVFPQSQYVATASSDTTVRIWNAQTGAEKVTIRTEMLGKSMGAIFALATPINTLRVAESVAVTSFSGDIALFDVDGRQIMQSRPYCGPKGGEGHAVAFTPDGLAIISSGDCGDVTVTPISG